MNRRNLIRGSLGGVAAAGVLPFVGLSARATTPTLRPVVDEATGLPLLKLPAGYSYRSFAWTGDAMLGGAPTPGSHDGMAVLNGKAGNEIVLARNHERMIDVAMVDGETPIYDTYSVPAGTVEGLPDGVPGIGGGVSGVQLRDGVYVGTAALLAGTAVNCAGGPTPWNSWLTCEETVMRLSLAGGKDHGYVFEVPATTPASAQPIKDMGLFSHEAAAVDPRTGYVYLTEDNGPNSGFYRFRPKDNRQRTGALEAGGALDMLRVAGAENANADLTSVPQGKRFPVEWVPIAEPDSDPESLEAGSPGAPEVIGMGKSGPYLQGEAGGGAVFLRGEGAWYYDGIIYWIDTAGGPVHAGSVWAYDPAKEQLTALYASPGTEESSAIDNLTLSPSGNIIACEDHSGTRAEDGTFLMGPRLISITREGKATVVGENNMLIENPMEGKSIAPGDYRGSEWAGATFSADGNTLYVNIQRPGVTFAITGPWT